MSTLPPIDVAVSDDGSHMELRDRSGAVSRLSAEQVDALVRDIARRRAGMRPVQPAEPPLDRDQIHTADNLLWTVQPSPRQPAVEICVQHPGLGWLILSLLRAQVEDLTASLAFSSHEIMRFRMKS